MDTNTDSPLNRDAAAAPVEILPSRRKRPPICLRVFLQLFSFILSVILTAGLLATVAAADANRLTSGGGMRQLIRAALLPAPHSPRGSLLGAGGVPIAMEDAGGSSLSDTGGSDPWMDYIYDTLTRMLKPEDGITEEQARSFLEKSTVTDYLADKAASFADDALNGTENTAITTDEIVALVEENKHLIESEFHISVTADTMAQVRSAANEIVEKENINQTIRDGIRNAVKASPLDPGGKLLSLLRAAASADTLYLCIGLCAALILMLCALNFYNVPAGLTWASLSCILAGVLASLPLAAVGLIPPAGEAQIVISFVRAFTGVLIPIHCCPAALGVGLLVICVVWRVIRAGKQDGRPAQA